MAELERDLALVRAELGDFARCEELAAESLATFREHEAKPRILADAESVLGGCLAGQKRFAEAEPLLLASYQTLLKSVGSQARQTREAHARIITAYEAQGRRDEAARYRAMIPAGAAAER